MSDVSIANLKANLSHYIRLARSGRTVTVKNRSEEVARLVAAGPSPSGLTLRTPAPGAGPPGRVPLPRPVRLRRDPVALLLEERTRTR